MTTSRLRPRFTLSTADVVHRHRVSFARWAVAVAAALATFQATAQAAPRVDMPPATIPVSTEAPARCNSIHHLPSLWRAASSSCSSGRRTSALPLLWQGCARRLAAHRTSACDGRRHVADLGSHQQRADHRGRAETRRHEILIELAILATISWLRRWHVSRCRTPKPVRTRPTGESGGSLSALACKLPTIAPAQKHDERARCPQPIEEARSACRRRPQRIDMRCELLPHREAKLSHDQHLGE